MDMTNEENASGQLQLLSEAADALARSSDLDTAVERLLTLAVDTLGASLGVVYLQDPDRVELQLGVTVGVDEPLGAGLEGSLVGTDDAVTQTARDRNPRTVSGGDVPAVLGGAGIATALLRGLTVSRSGIDIPVGVLLVGWDDAVELAAEHDELATAIAD